MNIKELIEVLKKFDENLDVSAWEINIIIRTNYILSLNFSKENIEINK